MGHAEDLRPLVVARGNVEQVAAPVERLRYRYPLVQIVAARRGLGAAYADLDGEARAYPLPYGLKHGKRQAAAVFQAAAPFVPSRVDLGGKELAQKPAVAHMHRHHPEAAGLGKGGGVGEAAYGVLDQLLRHFVILVAVRVDAGDRPVNPAALGPCPVGVQPGVGKLGGGYGPVPRNGRREQVQGAMVAVIVQMYHVLAEEPVDRIDGAVADADGGGAAPSLFLIKGRVLEGRAVARVQAPAGNGGGEYAVSKPGVAEPYGLEEARILAFIHMSRSFRWGENKRRC